MIKTVIQVLPKEDFKVYVYFSDGKVKLFDMNPLLEKGVFKSISNTNDFMNKCTVMNGTLAWDIAGNFNEWKCLDIDPETIYKEGEDVVDPLDTKAA
jgi:hypothetical protein